MNASLSTTSTGRAGRWLGLAWRGFGRQEARAGRWLAGKGLPMGMARLLLWIVKLAMIGVLLFAAFWFALVVLFCIAIAWVVRNSDSDDEDKLEWREGHSGFGLYDENEWRHDMGDPDEP